MVTCTTAPAGAASGHTVIDPPSDPPATGATCDDAHLAIVDAEADLGALGVVAGAAVDDSSAAGAPGRSVAVLTGTAGLDVTVTFALHAAITKGQDADRGKSSN